MNNGIKSGKEILTEFFSGLETDESLDSDTVAAVTQLFNDGKLSDKSIANALSELRDAQDSDKD